VALACQWTAGLSGRQRNPRGAQIGTGRGIIDQSIALELISKRQKGRIVPGRGREPAMTRQLVGFGRRQWIEELTIAALNCSVEAGLDLVLVVHPSQGSAAADVTMLIRQDGWDLPICK